MDLEKLRHLNQELLQKLRTNQELFRKQIQAQPALPSSQLERTTLQGRRVLDAENGKENQNQWPKEGSDTASPILAEARCRPTPLGLRSPSKPAPSRIEAQMEGPPKAPLHPTSSGMDVIFVPSTEALGSAQESRQKGNNRETKRSHGKPSGPSKTCSVSKKPGPGAGEKLDEALVGGVGQARASARMPPGPRAILLTPRCDGPKEKTTKEAGHVTFVSDPEERLIPAGDWSVRPFLGYDWIAGLLDMDSSLADKPEQYFCELQDFRRVNRDDCIYDRDSRLDGLGSSATDREPETDLTSHQCVFCYQVNKRLFAAPLGPESACPVCKTPRAQRPPETLVEPAFVRVSIPRSTLLPAYKHKIHRRKSYEAADNLALPSHCLAGWENPARAVSPTLSSLDLRSSFRADQNSAPGGSGRTKTDMLLEVSCAAAFELGTLPRRWGHQKTPSCKAD